MLCHKGLIVLISAVDPTGTIYLLLFGFALPGPEFTHSRLVEDRNGKHPIPNQAGDRTLRNRELISRVNGDVMDGLPLPDQGRNDVINAAKL